MEAFYYIDFKVGLLQVPPVWNYNLDVPSHSDHMHYSLEVSTVPYVKKIKRKHKKGRGGRGSIGIEPLVTTDFVNEIALIFKFG